VKNPVRPATSTAHYQLEHLFATLLNTIPNFSSPSSITMRSALSVATTAARRNITRAGRNHHRHEQSHSSLSHLAQTYHSCTKGEEPKEEQQEQNQHQYNAVHQSLMIPSQSNQHQHNYLQSRNYVTSTTPNSKSAPTLVMGFGALAAAAKAGQLTVQAYNEWQATRPPPEKEEEGTKMNAESKQEGTTGEKTETQKEKSGSGTGGKRENIFAKFFNMNVGAKYYEGGFDDKMTRKEAALILGVRESSTPKRIKDAHRKLLILNHPDTGGSTYIAGKLNEAKELLLKGNIR
jgi:hypothetical protein